MVTARNGARMTTGIRSSRMMTAAVARCRGGFPTAISVNRTASIRGSGRPFWPVCHRFDEIEPEPVTMIKAVWLAVLCGVVFAVAAAVRDSGDAPVATTAEAEPATVGMSVAPDSASESSVVKRAAGDASTTAASTTVSSADTLTKADRLDVAPPPAPADAAPALAALPAETPPAAAAAPVSAKTKAAARPRHDANAKMIAAPAPAGQAKATPPKKTTTVARAKAETKCRRPDGFAGFLRSLNIGPRCAT